MATVALLCGTIRAKRPTSWGAELRNRHAIRSEVSVKRVFLARFCQGTAVLLHRFITHSNREYDSGQHVAVLKSTSPASSSDRSEIENLHSAYYLNRCGFWSRKVNKLNAMSMRCRCRKPDRERRCRRFKISMYVGAYRVTSGFSH